jgi:asparagine synthase (glutamine-hydrolysing)
MAVSLDGRLTGPEEYWRLDFRPDPRPTEDEWIEELDATLRDSVRAHLVSDVPFGAFLSGGTDSSAVVAYMAQLLDRPVRTFTIGFEEEEASEAAWAEQGARRWGTEHHVEVVRPQALDILPDLVRHYGEPFGDSSAIPTYYVSRMARRHVPMVLSGDGGDEAFAGYPTYRGWMQWVRRRLAPPPRSAWRALLRPVARRLMPWRYPTPEGTASLEGWLGRVQYLSAEQRRALWRPEFRRVMRSPLALFEAEYARGRDWSLCSRVQYLDIKTYLPCDILTKVDVASMMHGLEVRTPLVDARVMELAARIPEPLAMAQDADGGWTGKRLLKRLLERYYPPEYVRRPKMGFSMPVQRWFAAGGALRGMVQEQLLARGALLHEFFDPAGIRPLIEANEHGPVWLMLFLEEWLRQNRSQVSA